MSTCELAPPGWHCTRDAGHDGPCAAVPDEQRDPGLVTEAYEQDHGELSPADVKRRERHRRLEVEFTYHPPKNDEQVHRYKVIRDRAYGYASYIVSNTPPGSEQDEALTHLQQAVFWANAAIARNE